MNIRDAQDSFEMGKRRWEEYISAKELEWNAPVIMEDLIMGLASLPEEVLSQLPGDTQNRMRNLLGGSNGNFKRPIQKTQSRFSPKSSESQSESGAREENSISPLAPC